MADEVEPLHIALSKALYPEAKRHPMKDTSAMLLDVSLLLECGECDERCAVRMCERHAKALAEAYKIPLREPE